MTSAQSGENYRNWWPHPVMTAFTDHATDLLQDIADASGDRIHMTRRGDALDTTEELIAALQRGYGTEGAGRIRVRMGGGYQPASSADLAGRAGRGGRAGEIWAGARTLPEPGRGFGDGRPCPPGR